MTPAPLRLLCRVWFGATLAVACLLLGAATRVLHLLPISLELSEDLSVSTAAVLFRLMLRVNPQIRVINTVRHVPDVKLSHPVHGNAVSPLGPRSRLGSTRGLLAGDDPDEPHLLLRLLPLHRAAAAPVRPPGARAHCDVRLDRPAPFPGAEHRRPRRLVQGLLPGQGRWVWQGRRVRLLGRQGSPGGGDGADGGAQTSRYWPRLAEVSQ